MFWEDTGEINDKQKKADAVSSSKQDSFQNHRYFQRELGKSIQD